MILGCWRVMHTGEYVLQDGSEGPTEFTCRTFYGQAEKHTDGFLVRDVYGAAKTFIPNRYVIGYSNQNNCNEWTDYC